MSDDVTILTANWLGIGKGPLLLNVLSGTAVVLSDDDTPAVSRTDGALVASVIGAAATRLAAGSKWWIKALVAETSVSIVGPAAAAIPPPAVMAALAPVTSVNGYSGPNVKLGAHDVGSLTAAEIVALIAADAPAPLTDFDAGYA